MVTEVYNFSPGPAMLPREVMQQAQQEFLAWHDGLSAMEVSHRSAHFMHEIVEQSAANFRELMQIPDNYQILFLPGGATLQFAAIPLNLLKELQQPVDYFCTGHWSQKAITEARKYARVNIVTDNQDSKFTTIADPQSWRLDPQAVYVHYTPNETIAGLEFATVPEVGGRPLIADMSSCILSRQLDVSKFGIIYAGAQKNLGPAGITAVIIREDLIAEALSFTPSVINYQIQAQAKSCYNTPPTYNWYLLNLVLQWAKKQGGVAELEQRNIRKSKLLYDYIDASNFYFNSVDPRYRSRMNVVFFLADPKLDNLFLQAAADQGLMNLKGHALFGGMRASIYNAMPETGVIKLLAFMEDFARRYE